MRVATLRQTNLSMQDTQVSIPVRGKCALQPTIWQPAVVLSMCFNPREGQMRVATGFSQA